MISRKVLLWLPVLLVSWSCKDSESTPEENTPRDMSGFYFGADLSYVNQILDHGGVYRDNGAIKDPYAIFKDHGTKLVRLRLWHNPAWTKEVYGEAGAQLYSDIYDVAKSIQLSRAQGMQVLLDFHFSDRWADPDSQDVPEAWKAITDINVLEDSVHHYTKKVLTFLNGKNLMPEWVQIGNETNCGMLFTDAPESFPSSNVCDGGAWVNMGRIVRAAIQAVDDVAKTSTIKTKVMLHVADPKNVEWWFDNITTTGGVTDFDLIGISYYPLWHTTVKIDQLSDKIALFKSKYNKPVIIVETGYPWTTAADDSYNNAFSDGTPLAGYPFTKQGQSDLLIKLAQEIVDGGGIGLVYWEPAWISSDMKDLWGTGSSWENTALFDFDGNPVTAMDYTKAEYK